MGWVKHVSPEVAAQSQYPTIIAVCVVLTLLMMATVITRVVIRYRQRRTGADDYVVIFGMASCSPY